MSLEVPSVDEQKLAQITALASQNKTTGYDTELFEDQESIKKNSLECAICTGVIKQATSILACGHVFCSFCISDALKRRKACPVCAAVIDDPDKAVAPALFVDRLIQQLRLKCPHSAKGCGWQGPLSDLPSHLDNTCDYHLFLCEYSRAGCDAILTRSTLATHNTERTRDHLDLIFGALLATQALNEQLQDRVTALEQRATRWEAHYAEFVSSPLLQRLLHKAAEEEKVARRNGGLSSARRDEAKQGRLTPSTTDGAVTTRSASEHSNPPSSRQAPASPAAQPQPAEAVADEDINSTLVMDMEKLDRMMQIPELMGNPEVNKFLTSVKAAPDLMQSPEVERFLVSVWEQVSAQL